MQGELATLGGLVRTFLLAEAALQDASVRAGRPFRPLRETAAELIVIAARDAGLDEPMPYVRASVRASLLAAHPTPEPLVGGTPQSARPGPMQYLPPFAARSYRARLERRNLLSHADRGVRRHPLGVVVTPPPRLTRSGEVTE